MSAARRVVIALALGLSLGGCALNLDATSLGVPVTMSAPPGETPEGDHFRVTTRAIYGVWGLFTLREPSLEKALATQLVGGSGVAGVRIKVRSRWSDVLISALTLGLIVPRAVTYEGVVTR